MIDTLPAIGPSRTRRTWAPAALALLLALTALAYTWNLTENGMGNTFYAAAVQAGTVSWKAFFFGSFDAAGFITVDKPPISLWVMELSGRLFGFSSLSMLAPAAVFGTGSVGLLYLTVRRVWGTPAALLAGAALALTPVAALMFRFNNPDATLTFLLVAAAYCVTRAVGDASVRWLTGAAVLLGTAFLTKSLQAFLVLPGMTLAYLIAAPAPTWTRIRHLTAAGGALAVSSLWWPIIVDSIPASARPYAGGSTTNSVLELALGTNGLDRLTGATPAGTLPGSATGVTGPGVQIGGETGILRLVNERFGGQAAWLLPAALIALAAGLILTRRAPRTDQQRAGLVLWGGWALVTAVVLSFASGTIHPYYTVALAPATAVLATAGLPVLWRRRAELTARLLLVTELAATAGISWYLLSRVPGWQPWLRWTIAALAAALCPLLLAERGRAGATVRRLLAVSALGTAAAGMTAWTLVTLSLPHTGSVPTSGPAGIAAVGDQGFGGQGFGGQGSGGQGFGGQGADRPADPAVAALLRSSGAQATWAAATTSSQTAGPLELATGLSVMSLGGFRGADPAISLAGFQSLVQQGKVRYFVAGGLGGGFGGAGGGFGGGFGGGTATDAGQIATWVAATFPSTAVGSATVYDLQAPAASSAPGTTR